MPPISPMCIASPSWRSARQAAALFSVASTAARLATCPWPIKLVAQARLAEGGGGIDQHAVADRLPAQQHAVGHGIAVGERDLDGPLAVADADRRGDDVAHLALAVGARHAAPVHDAGDTDDLHVVAARDGMHAEAHLLGPA